MMDPAHLAIFCGVTSHVKTSFALPTCLNPDCLKKKKNKHRLICQQNTPAVCTFHCADHL